MEALKYVVIDAETTVAFKGSPFYQPNKLACMGYWTWDGHGAVLDIEYTDGPKGDSVALLQRLVDDADVVVAFNAKFDLHWLHRLGVVVHRPVWCLQVYEFVSTAQATAYPSLEGVLTRTGMGVKSKGIEEFWDAGYDTCSIPWKVLEERCLSDVQQEAKLFEWQQADLATRSRDFQALLQLEMMDLRCLEEAEWNGQLFDKVASLARADELDEQIKGFTQTLGSVIDCPHINWNSADHKSAALYGGLVHYERREQVGIYKTGDKIGQPRYRVYKESVELPRLLDPAEGTELDKAGFYSTAEPVLRDLKAKGKAKTLIGALLKRQELDKAVGTYYRGIPKLIDEREWRDNVVHGQFNQCVAITGRLSSSKPNQQNQPDEVKEFMVTRFPCFV